ncbi:hypothetical protein [Ferruginibacter sp.]
MATTLRIITVNVDIVASSKSLESQYSKAENESFFIVITLENTQDTTVHFTTMTCSWEDSFVFNNDSMYLYYPGCDSNYPTSLDIIPHGKVKFFAELAGIGKNYDWQNPPSFKIGFADLPSKFFWENHSRRDKMKYPIFWSDNTNLISSLYDYKEEKIPGSK